MDSLKECIGQDWDAINTTKRLRGCLLHAVRILRRLGETDWAADWEQRVRQMPRRMSRESIKVVLFGACLEAEKRGMMVGFPGAV